MQYAFVLLFDRPIMASIASVIIFIIALIVIGSVVYACFSQSQSQRYHDPPPPYPGNSVPPTAPPPPGFRSEYVPSSAEGIHYLDRFCGSQKSSSDSPNLKFAVSLK
jgi:hypothetical protein